MRPSNGRPVHQGRGGLGSVDPLLAVLMSVQQGGGWQIRRQARLVMKMNGPNGKSIDRAGSGSAKVFALFPTVLISVICSVCYRMHAARREAPLLVGSFAVATLEPEVRRTSCRLNETDR